MFYGVVIQMFWNEHAPPHFHALYAEDEASDETTFASASVVLGAVTWPNGADLAPDAMYDAIRERGRCVIE